MVQNDKGAALVGALLVTVILSMLGTVSLNLAANEIEQVGTAADEAVAQHLAESGSDLVMQWFHDPGSPSNLSLGNLLEKRFDSPESGPSFFDPMEKSQFVGTSSTPDILYDASRPTDDRRLNDPVEGWFRSLRSLGRILRLKVYGPSRPGLLCTVEVTAGAKGLSRTVAVQLGTWNIPPIRAGVQIGNNGVMTTPHAALPVKLHWGDMKIKGNVLFEKREEIPIKTQLAAVNGQSYGATPLIEDRWLDLYIGGEALFALSPLSSVIMPSNVYPRQDPNPGLHEDRWNYETMKKYAMLFGSYYASDRDGLLYRNGTIQPGFGLTPDEVFTSDFVGDHHGLVFIDTLDQRPPHAGNLGSISIATEYAEGLFIVNAHLHFKPKGAGKSVPALSPPNEGSSSLGSRIPVELSKMHIQGVLHTAGDFFLEGSSRLYGALSVAGKVLAASDPSNILEVWYNHDLRSGLFRGVPLVYVAPGTWQPKN